MYTVTTYLSTLSLHDALPIFDADAHLDRHRHLPGGPHGGGHDVPEQRPADGQGGAAALAGHLGDRAAEVEVDVVGAGLGDEVADGLADGPRLGAVELDRPHRLVVG